MGHLEKADRFANEAMRIIGVAVTGRAKIGDGEALIVGEAEPGPAAAELERLAERYGVDVVFRSGEWRVWFEAGGDFDF